MKCVFIAIRQTSLGCLNSWDDWAWILESSKQPQIFENMIDSEIIILIISGILSFIDSEFSFNSRIIFLLNFIFIKYAIIFH